MAAFFEHWRSFSGLPVFVFILLVIITFAIYRYYLHRSSLTPNMLDGAVIMAVGIFAYACLPRVATPNFFMLLVALELLAIWICIGFNLLQTYLYNPSFLRKENEKVALGTWVIATVVTVLLLNKVDQTLHGFILMLSLAAIVLCAIYLIIISQYTWHFIKSKYKSPLNAMILLASIGVEAIALLLATIFHNVLPMFIYQIIIIFGGMLYIIGLLMLFAHTIVAENASSAEESLVYTGIATTGLSMLVSQAFSGWVNVAMWWSALAAFLLVEIPEFFKLIIHSAQRQNVFAYNSLQWLRNFAFGMFYAFTLSCYDQGYATNSLVVTISTFGQYIVAILLFIQIVTALYHVRVVRRG